MSKRIGEKEMSKKIWENDYIMRRLGKENWNMWRENYLAEMRWERSTALSWRWFDRRVLFRPLPHDSPVLLSALSKFWFRLPFIGVENQNFTIFFSTDMRLSVIEASGKILAWGDSFGKHNLNSQCLSSSRRVPTYPEEPTPAITNKKRIRENKASCWPSRCQNFGSTTNSANQ